jgi:hypothetical protein
VCVTRVHVRVHKCKRVCACECTRERMLAQRTCQRCRASAPSHGSIPLLHGWADTPAITASHHHGVRIATAVRGRRGEAHVEGRGPPCHALARVLALHELHELCVHHRVDLHPSRARWAGCQGGCGRGGVGGRQGGGRGVHRGGGVVHSPSHTTCCHPGGHIQLVRGSVMIVG